jgi:hypothetical protein
MEFENMNCIPVNLDYLKKRGWSSKEIAENIRDIDKEGCPEYPFNVEECIRDIDSPYEYWFLLFDKDNNKITGYLSSLSVNKERHNRIINGLFVPGELGYGEPLDGDLYLYIAGMVILKKYQTDISNFKKLLVVFVGFLTEILKKDIVICSISARGFTLQGQKLCEDLGMKKIITHRDQGIIYNIDLDTNDYKESKNLSLFHAVQDAKAKRMIKYLKTLGEKKGMNVIKTTLADWGYKVDGV